MKFLEPHIVAIGRVLVLMFFLASSGFTVVMYSCTMQDMGCCGTAKEEMSGTCTMMDMSQGTNGPSVSSGEKCSSLSIAGGLKTDPTIVEKASTHRETIVDHSEQIVPLFSLPAADFNSQIHPFIASPNLSPPAVEKYVLASTFRI